MIVDLTTYRKRTQDAREWLESYWKKHTPEERIQAFQEWSTDKLWGFISCEKYKNLPDSDRQFVSEEIKSWLEILMRRMGELKFNPDHLVPGNIIVMWDGKSFGFYPDLDSAIQDARERITDRKNCFSPPKDFECLEFLEVVDEEPGSLRNYTLGGCCRNEHGTRMSFDYPVKDLGNQLERLL